MWSSTNVRSPSKTVSIRLSSSGSKLTLYKEIGFSIYIHITHVLFEVKYTYLQRSWIFCIFSSIGSSSVASCRAVSRLWMLDHHGRSQGNITRAIFDMFVWSTANKCRLLIKQSNFICAQRYVLNVWRTLTNNNYIIWKHAISFVTFYNKIICLCVVDVRVHVYTVNIYNVNLLI